MSRPRSLTPVDVGPIPSRNGASQVSPEQRFRGGRKCPICKGSDDLRRGSGERCHGYLSDDGKWCHCSREDHAGLTALNPLSMTYPHLLKGDCPCGHEHEPADPEPTNAARARRPFAASYDYTDSKGKLLFQCVRYEPKDFRQRRPDPDKPGRMIWNLKGVDLVLFRLRRLLHADPAKVVVVVEGEKDVLRLEGNGFVATCNAMGAGKWRQHYAETLRDRHVVVIPDNDVPGCLHAQQVATSLAGIAASVKILELPDLPEKGDVSDWLDRGGSADDLKRMIVAAPEFDPATVEPHGSKEGVNGVAKGDSPINPDSPARPGKSEEEWKPLRLGRLPAVEPFPLDVLPLAAANLVVEASTAVGCDPGMVACSVLGVAAGMIGRSVRLCLGSNWFSSSTLFVNVVGLAGDGKSPALSYAASPVRTIDQELADEFAREKKEYQDAVKDTPKGEKPGVAAPIPKRIMIEDCTLEAMFRVLAANGRGLLMTLDEIEVLLASLGQYKGGRGNDRANVLKLWAGAPVTIDRVLNPLGEPIRIPHPSLSIVGAGPPETLHAMISNRGYDGFLDRWLFCFPDRRPKLKRRERQQVGNETIKEWTQLARSLWERQMVVDDRDDKRSVPAIIYFTDEGKEAFYDRDDRHVDEVNHGDFPDHLRGPWSKLQEYAGRLALTLCMMHHAADPESHLKPLPSVSAQDARDAWRLVDYFKSHHRRVRAYLQGNGAGGAPEFVKLILNWIKAHPDRTSFSRSELTQIYPPSRGYDRAMVEDALAWLEQKHAIRPTPTTEKPSGTPGRKPSPSWAIHPDLSTLRAQENQDFQENTPDHAGLDPDSPEYPDSPARKREREVFEL